MKCLDLNIYQLNRLFDRDLDKWMEIKRSTESQEFQNEWDLLLAKQKKEMNELINKQGSKFQPAKTVDIMDKDDVGQSDDFFKISDNSEGSKQNV